MVCFVVAFKSSEAGCKSHSLSLFLSLSLLRFSHCSVALSLSLSFCFLVSLANVLSHSAVQQRLCFSTQRSLHLDPARASVQRHFCRLLLTAFSRTRQQLVPLAHDLQLAWQTVLLTEPPPQRFCNLLMTSASSAGLLVVASSQQEERRCLLALHVTLRFCQGEFHHLAALQSVRRTFQFCWSCWQLLSCLNLLFFLGAG